jgi:hypothetical protein
MPRVICYSTGHVSSSAVCDAFADGSDKLTCLIDAGQPAASVDAANDGFVYGKLRGTLAVMSTLMSAGRRAWYCDNGYLRPSDRDAAKPSGRYQGFYKVSLNGFQCSGEMFPGAAANPPASPGSPPGDAAGLARAPINMAAAHERLRRLGVNPQPRSAGSEILVCPPIPDYCRVMGFDGEAWLAGNLRTLRASTDRPVRVRYRPGDPRAARRTLLAEDLRTAFALVTHDSNVVVEAVLAGVPAFVTGDSPAAVLGNTDLAAIETPAWDPAANLDWLAVLAANQWTLGELRDGSCWKDLKSIYGDPAG